MRHKMVEPMYVARNRFKIVKGEEDAFEEVWRTRERHLDRVAGYEDFEQACAGTAESSGLDGGDFARRVLN